MAQQQFEVLEQPEYNSPIIKDNALFASPNSLASETDQGRQSGAVLPARENLRRQTGGRHSIRAERTISEESLRLFLLQRKSPLSSYSSQLLASPYWSTIIGICTIEQYGCTRAPGNNYWGIMCKGRVCPFASIPDGIAAIDALLTKYEAKGKDTIEELNGYYVVPASNNWLNTVTRTKQALENL